MLFLEAKELAMKSLAIVVLTNRRGKSGEFTIKV